jgi:ATP sulfurylase
MRHQKRLTREFRLEAILSGIRVSEMLQRIELPPPEDSRREVAAILLPWAPTDQHLSNPSYCQLLR